MRTVTDAALHEVAADLVLVLIDDGSGKLIERSRVRNPRFLTASRDDAFGALSPERLAEHFASDKRLRVHGEHCAQYFSHVPERYAASMLVTQLTMAARTIGYIAALSFTPNKLFDEGQRKLLSIVSDRAAAAIENAKLYEDLQATFS